jgi:G3E family GTPase
MRAANRLILTKTDTVLPGHLAALAATLRAINPLAEISAANHGSAVPLPDLAATPLTLTAATAPMLAHAMALPAADWPAISLWLSGLLHAHGDHILRVKGVIRSPAGRLLIQTVRRAVQPPEVLPEGSGTDDSLAFIGHSYDPQALDASLRRFLG